MPEQKTSGQPMDTYAGGPGYAGPMGGNNPPASAQDAVPLTGEKTASSLPQFGADAMMQDMTKGGDQSAPTFPASEGMQDTSGAH